MGSKVANILKSVAPIALPILGSLVAPGIGTALGSTLGESALGAIGGGLGGAAGGGLSGGGLSGALKGGALGAAGGYLSSGGASELFGGTQLGNTFGLSNPEGGSFIGNALGGPSSGTGLGSLLGGGGSSAYSPADTNFLNKASLSSQGFSPADIGFLDHANAGLASPSLSAGIGGSGSSYGGIQGLGTLLGAANSLSANDQAQKDLLDAQNKALGQLQPYQATGAAANNKLSQLLGTSGSDNGQTASDILAASPEYQFQLQQGNLALDRQQAAKGNYFSGAALKAAQDYGQGLASQTAQQYYNNLAQQSGQGANVAGSAAGINENTGNAKAAAGISSSNILNQTLSSLLGGSGAKKPINIGGQVYYV